MASVADIRAAVARAIDGLDETQQMVGLIVVMVQQIHAVVGPLGEESSNEVLHNAIGALNVVENRLTDSIGWAQDVRIGLNGYLRQIGVPPIE